MNGASFLHRDVGLQRFAFPADHGHLDLTADLNAVLSASSYPVPTQLCNNSSASPSSHIQLPPPFSHDGFSSGRDSLNTVGMFGFELESTGKTNHEPVRVESPARAKDESRKKVPRTRRRPSNVDGEDPKKRRRIQVRTAQQAYRARKESRLSSLADQVGQLEAAVQMVSSTMVSLCDELMRSGALAAHIALTHRLRESIQTCLELVKVPCGDNSVECNEDSKAEAVSAAHRHVQTSPSSLSGELGPPKLSCSSPAKISAPHDVCSFMHRLHIAIAYHGYLLLANPSASPTLLQRHFRLLFTVMSRENMASYFAACLHAAMCGKKLERKWSFIPCFQLGGAGLHFTKPERTEGGLLYTRRSQQWRIVTVPLTAFGEEEQKLLDGDWFDMVDLELFLRQELAERWREKDSLVRRQHVDAEKLLRGLLNSTFCLGRVAGFRRRDVDEVLSAALCAS